MQNSEMMVMLGGIVVGSLFLFFLIPTLYTWVIQSFNRLLRIFELMQWLLKTPIKALSKKLIIQFTLCTFTFIVLFVLDKRGSFARYFSLECAPLCKSYQLPFLLQSNKGNWSYSIVLKTKCDRFTFYDEKYLLDMTLYNAQSKQMLLSGSKIRLKQSGYFEEQVLFTLPSNLSPKTSVTFPIELQQSKCPLFNCDYAKNFPTAFTLELLESSGTGEVYLNENALQYSSFSFPSQSFKGELLQTHSCNNRYRKYVQILGWNKARKTTFTAISSISITGDIPPLAIRGTNDHVTSGPIEVPIELGFGRSIVLVDNKGDADGEVDDAIRALLLEGKVSDGYDMTDPVKVEKLRSLYPNITDTIIDLNYLKDNFHTFADGALYLITVANSKDDSILSEMQSWFTFMNNRYSIKPIIVLTDCENHQGIDTTRANLIEKFGQEVHCISLTDYQRLSARDIDVDKSINAIELITKALSNSCNKRYPYNAAISSQKNLRSTKNDEFCLINSFTGLDVASMSGLRKSTCDKAKKAAVFITPVIPLGIADIITSMITYC
jgi:hypothetical protein